MVKQYERKKITLEQIEKIEALTQKNVYRRRIAEIVGCSKDTVWRYQKILGLL